MQLCFMKFNPSTDFLNQNKLVFSFRLFSHFSHASHSITVTITVTITFARWKSNTGFYHWEYNRLKKLEKKATAIKWNKQKDPNTLSIAKHLSLFPALGAVQILLNILPSPFTFFQLSRQFSTIWLYRIFFFCLFTLLISWGSWTETKHAKLLFSLNTVPSLSVCQFPQHSKHVVLLLQSTLLFAIL